ncbi:hypothetical protein ABQF35_14350 [Mycobacterium syngnathidarum]
MMDMDRPTDAPWPIEEVGPSDLVLGDVVKIDNNPWLQITRVVEAGEDQPEWEKPAGGRAFVLSPIDDDQRITFAFVNLIETVWRRSSSS